MQISLKQVAHIYQEGTPFEFRAIHDINVEFPSGSFIGVIGHTGSGKSTLLQHLNALLKPSEGSVTIGERMITSDKKMKNLKAIRKQVGIVFQFPEHQLFEETVEKDICFGPMNFGVSEEEAKARARAALELVGLHESLLNVSPFDLSGGQMRRVAIAGVLAMEPEVIVLDEPTAGLDPKGRKEIMEMFYKLHKEKGITTILVTHSMEDAARYADELVIMNKGTIVKKAPPSEIFAEPEELMELGLAVPDTVRFQLDFEEKTGLRLTKRHLSMEELAIEIKAVLGGGEL
ncbi:cobalt transporter ATP-binding subunit [Bacillus sp. FJAT-27916]|uniref:energy-coupling factor ABC transporter ATP-binding protein n=1 Tax=Bacillaceae TaxID=186817 RepID=UPI0006711CEF|nr:energy-coupling factor ABC transporter ATP-binding protein [Bacillus sp. FJAT-27916]KMY46068.1 cobalt transporter ATP-binding subunit [Bacillus sp. FJAT-27916]